MAENLEEMFAAMIRQIEDDYEKLDIPVVDSEVIIEEMMLPMSDGVKLKTYIYKTEYDDAASYPVIVQRSPYAHAMGAYAIHGKNLAKRGFRYILQFCRGTGGSEGEWQPNVNERQDGLETLQWINDQPWVDSIGYWGDSYLALTGWSIADAVPNKVKGMYLGVYGTDRFTSAYQKGLFRHDVLTSWAMENAGFEVKADYLESCMYRPHIEVDEKLWGRKIPWYRDWITATKEDDDYWQHGFWKLLRDIPKNVKIPLLITEGWYDHHLGSALKSYDTLNDDVKEKCSLIIGSWNHYSMNCLEWSKPKNLRNSEVESMVNWFTVLLKEKEIPKKKTSLYIIGKDEWIDLDTWPIPVKEQKTFYFSKKESQGFLSREPQMEGQVLAEYDYDPNNPVPSLGGESMLKTMDHVGSMYQPEIGFRDDVISFVSDEVEDSFVIGGKINVTLQVSSDCKDTAFTAKLMEIKEDGKAVNIRSSITTISADHPDTEYVPGSVVEVSIDMWDIFWEVQKGAKLRLDLSSSDFPQYAVHSNETGIWSKQETSKIAHQRILSGSKIELPTI